MGVFYTNHDMDARRHEIGVAALTRFLQSVEYGRALMSDYVYDEVMTQTHQLMGSVGDGIGVGRRIQGERYPDAIEMLHTSLAHFDDGFDGVVDRLVPETVAES